ncbi:IS630 family transposase [Myxococcus sp. CA051A]|nr:MULTISPECIES: IS630 family transposase [unclassified Myxococcus]NTX17872.1 IS630 family transposase [Myxococcus sp. CA056]NTX36169.1 IS630 family transposase [Myxococcus sp. CA033]NTX58869.1 IS630 family transposase [Myxococcus sp. CA039A]NTX67795.1 IS630 family transposase [Myxococcus sp. CA051A]
MAWQPKHWTVQQLEERRLAAGKLLRRGHLSQAEVARRVGVSEASVSRWARRLHEAGGSTRGLKARPRTGRPSKLSLGEWQQVSELVRAGARTCGFPTERWTLTRVAHLIQRTFGVHYHPNYLAECLHRLGLSPQQPRTRAKERDDALVEAWLKRDWPRIKRGLEEAGGPLPSWTRQVVRFGPA